jgi:hypothetical protein
MRKPDLILSDAPFSFEIRLLQQILSAGKDIRRQANLCVHVIKEHRVIPDSARQRFIKVQTGRGEAANSCSADRRC